MNPTSTFRLLSVQPRVFSAVSLRCVLTETRWRYVFLCHSSYTHPHFEKKMYTVTVGLQPLYDHQRQALPRKRQSIYCTVAELGLWFSKINLKSLFTFISITQISIYLRALLLDQHSMQLWELHCQPLPSRAAV